jgi:RNA polymerase sigma-70 factor (ECF subfamily)
VTTVPIELAITRATERSFRLTPQHLPESISVPPASTRSLSSAPSPDALLVHHLANGDDKGLEALYDRYGGPLYALAFTIVRDEADAEEIVMEAFLQAWRSAGRFDPARGSVASWLTVIVRSRALDLIRSRARRDRVMTTAAQYADGDAVGMGQGWDAPSDSIEQAERRQRVSAALRELPDAQKKVLQLAFYGGRSQSEIASMLEEPLGTIKTRARAGMRKLRESLGGYYMEHRA